MTTLFGVALQASLHGWLIVAMSWSIVGFGSLLVLVGLVRRRRPLGIGARTSRRKKRSRRALAKESRRVGHGILEFKRRRDDEAPHSISSETGWQALLPRSGRRRASRALRDHWDETVSLYKRDHGANARAVIRELRHWGELVEEEAAQLRAPHDPKEIEAVGLRLIELGDLLDDRRRVA